MNRDEYMAKWHSGDLNGYAWSQAFAKASEIAEEEMRVEREEAEYYGRHARSRYEGYLESEHLEWLIKDLPPDPNKGHGKHDILQRCSGWISNQYALDDMVWYNQGIKQFIRVKDATRLGDPGLDALKKRLRGLSGQLEMED